MLWWGGMKRLAAVIALSTLAASSRADAQCEPQRPSDPCDEAVEAVPVVVVAEPPPQQPEAFARRGGLRTHGVALETGHLLEPGTFQANARVYGFFTQFGVGLHERFELSAEVVGYGLFGAGVGGRLSLLPPDSKLKAVVGAKLWTLTISPIKPLQVSGTLGYQSDRLNIHVNVSEMPTEDSRVWLGSVGAYYEVTRIVSVGFDAGRVAVVDDPDGLDGVIAGIKLTGEKFDLDLVMAANGEAAIPLVGFTGRI